MVSEGSASIGSLKVNGVNVFQLMVKSDSHYLLTARFPQGSVLGSLLLFIYVNDFPKSCENIIRFLVADHENCLYVRNKNGSSSLQDGLK